jgi:ribosomal protein L11 methylase PrmA
MIFKPPRQVLACYLPTPMDVVERMLDLTGARSGDVVYDLGSGDGRLVIAAAKRGARGLGVEIEPYWVEQSLLNAEQAGVSHMARFELADACDLDLSPASVVVMYLGQSSMRSVSQRLMRECSPGTRVVSHSFSFTGFPAAKTETFVDAEGQNRTIHLWIAPDNPA